MLSQPKVRIALAVLILAALGGAVTGALGRRQQASTPITISYPSGYGAASGAPAGQTSGQQPIDAAATSSPDAAATIEVHITGAVKNPNLYELPVGARLNDAIKAAGGAKDDADIDAVNLAEHLQDGEKIYIPTHEDIKSIPALTADAPQNSIAGMPAAVPVADSSSSSSSASGTSSGGSSGTSSAGSTGAAKSSKGSKGKSGSRSNKLTDPSQGTINVNTAPANQLMRLPGVGKTIAQRIIAYRTANGPFKTPDDLTNVSGIGQKKLAKMRPFVRCN